MGMNHEEWKQVVGFQNYEVSNFGRVRNRYGKILNGSINKHGYHTVVLYKNKNQRRVMVHRLVAEAFLGKREVGKEINHINGIKTDNRVENIEWCTKSQNLLHKHYVLNKCVRRVMCVETGKEYGSIKEAAMKNDSHIPDIVRACKNNSTAAGYHWNYI